MSEQKIPRGRRGSVAGPWNEYPWRTDFDPWAVRRLLWKLIETSAGCWEFVGANASRTSYGHIKRSGLQKCYQAHRLSYQAAFGEIDDDVLVLHRCDNPPCVRPDHLFTGDYKANSTDMAQKGRGRGVAGDAHYSRRSPERLRTGPRIRDDVVSAIRGAGGTYDEIAMLFGVSRTTVSRIRNNRSRRK